MAYTTEQLIQILDQELRANWKGERILLSSANRLENSAIAKALGSHKLSKVFAYQDFRAQIHAYQQQQQVSGVVWRVCKFKDQEVRSPEVHNQLTTVAGDKAILISAKAAILEFWRQTTQGMRLWLAGHEPQETTPGAVEQLFQEAEWAEIDASRTELYLSLCWGDPKECHYHWAYPQSGCERIIAASDQPSLIKI